LAGVMFALIAISSLTNSCGVPRVTTTYQLADPPGLA
jgi:hypothetical protein